MVLPVSRGQILDRDPSVDLSRRHGSVAEDELDVAHIGAALEEVGRASVPEGVRGDALPETGRLGALADDQIERLHAESPARDRGDEESRLLRGRDEGRAGLPEIAPQSSEGVCANRHDAIPASLAIPDPDCPSLRVEVQQVQVAQLRPPEASGVEGFQYGMVSETEVVGPRG